MSQVPLQRLAPGQGQWYIPKNEVDNGFDNYQSISGGGEDTTSDSPVPNQTKSDVQWSNKGTMVSANNLERAA